MDRVESDRPLELGETRPDRAFGSGPSNPALPCCEYGCGECANLKKLSPLPDPVDVKEGLRVVVAQAAAQRWRSPSELEQMTKGISLTKTAGITAPLLLVHAEALVLGRCRRKPLLPSPQCGQRCVGGRRLNAAAWARACEFLALHNG